MSLHAVERLLFDLNRDPAKVDAFRSAPDEVLAGYDLDETERALFANRDVLGLYRHGVHPLLLAPAGRFFEIDMSDFRTRLLPALGERVR